jgi:hypothetical protein
MSFLSGQVECPAKCVTGGKKKRPVNLKLIERNYSGCGVDTAYCPKCGKGYEVSYRVDAVTPEPAWDQAPEEA